MANEPQVHPVHEPVTGTWQYVVADNATKSAIVVDPVLDYSKDTGELSTKSADQLLEVISQHQYKVAYILETHAHADHLTASRYLQKRLSQLLPELPMPKVGIGRRIEAVQSTMATIYSIPQAELEHAFDCTFADEEIFRVGNLEARVIHLPGHTPDHVGYVVGSNVFTGDSIFNPDVGSARCDFPGGSATELYSSIRKLLSLESHVRLYTGHDYPPESRQAPNDSGGSKAMPFTTVERQRRENKHVKDGTAESEFVNWRTERDGGLSEPKLMRQAMHVNVRGGRLPATDVEDFKITRIPPYVARVGAVL